MLLLLRLWWLLLLLRQGLLLLLLLLSRLLLLLSRLLLLLSRLLLLLRLWLLLRLLLWLLLRLLLLLWCCCCCCFCINSDVADVEALLMYIYFVHTCACSRVSRCAMLQQVLVSTSCSTGLYRAALPCLAAAGAHHALCTQSSKPARPVAHHLQLNSSNACTPRRCSCHGPHQARRRPLI